MSQSRSPRLAIAALFISIIAAMASGASLIAAQVVTQDTQPDLGGYYEGTLNFPAAGIVNSSATLIMSSNTFSLVAESTEAEGSISQVTAGAGRIVILNFEIIDQPVASNPIALPLSVSLSVDKRDIQLVLKSAPNEKLEFLFQGVAQSRRRSRGRRSPGSGKTAKSSGNLRTGNSNSYYNTNDENYYGNENTSDNMEGGNWVSADSNDSSILLQPPGRTNTNETVPKNRRRVRNGEHNANTNTAANTNNTTNTSKPANITANTNVNSNTATDTTPQPPTNDEIREQLRNLPSGEIARDIPNEMSLGETRRVRVYIAEKISGNPAINLNSNVPVATIKIGPVMEVLLISEDADAFAITRVQPSKTSIQGVGGELPTEWLWDVKPLSSGQHKLKVQAKVELTIKGHENQTIPVDVFSDVVTVNVHPLSYTFGLISEYWKWIVTTLIIPLAGWGGKKLWDSKRMPPEKTRGREN